MKVPNCKDLLKPTFEALKELGGSGTNKEIMDIVIEMMQLPDEVVNIPHMDSQGKQSTKHSTELDYQLGWAKSHLKIYGAISNSAKCIWTITPEYIDKDIDPDAVMTKINEIKQKEKKLKVKTQKENSTMKIPTERELMPLIFQTLKQLGGTGTDNDILETVIEILQLSDELVNVCHPRTTETELSYRLKWAKTYLKSYDVISEISHGVWTITPEYRKDINADTTTPDTKKQEPKVEKQEPQGPKEIDESWRDELFRALQTMPISAFEILVSQLLEKCGLKDVTVFSGDSNIKGIGKLSVSGVFNYNVAFQCKCADFVHSHEIRDFRDALKASDEGIFITTGMFTQDAKKEASNREKQQIDLIDGEELIAKLVEYGIGVHKKTVYEVDKAFFKGKE